ncbi:FAD-dependent oxidoreductase [Zobellella maritima]|uniref:FAD-dependent oxidoreductase n=1 Tax=Zobellella maritima TaxID=2059725 RepID=UPI000E302919|nr:FAD-dependent oxidoreductase [Zobellella maritima]
MKHDFSNVTAGGPLRVGILGGGVAGATVALRLADLGIHSVLIEASNGLVNGPPICHLHAGGNLYRDISDEQCLTLLRQSIASVRAYPHSINRRPTVIATPVSDAGNAEALLPRLAQVAREYQRLVAEDPANRVLGDPEHYYRCYSRAQFEALANRPLPTRPETPDDWMIPLAHHLDPDSLKFPLILVQEYGWSLFRMAATATLALNGSPHCELHFDTRAMELQHTRDGWLVHGRDHQGQARQFRVDFLVNACGFRTGQVDDMAGYRRQRLVEYKAAYLARWHRAEQWPEVIFHGERGTPQGMAQLTPYPNGIFQLHGMTDSITLFKNGLVASCEQSAQPRLPQPYQAQLEQGWQSPDIESRTRGAIAHLARLLPAFNDAEPAGKPLFGAQQIPGTDPRLRAADVSFEGMNYARVEIVKASSALTAADRIVGRLGDLGWIEMTDLPLSPSLALTEGQSAAEVEREALRLARERGYPDELALNME